MRHLITLFLLSTTSVYAQLGLNTDYNGTDCGPVQVVLNKSVSTLGNLDLYFSDRGNFRWTGQDTLITLYAGNTDVYVSGMNGQGMWISETLYFTIDGFRRLDIYPREACPNEEVDFYLSAEGFDDYTVDWDFGNGLSKTGVTSFESTYNTPGTYIITAITHSPRCGNLTLIDSVKIVSSANFSNSYITPSRDSVCPNDNVDIYYYNNSNSGYFNTTQSIDWGDGTVNDKYHHSYAAEGSYIITALYTSMCGNSASFQDTVVVSSNLLNNANNSIIDFYPDEPCPGEQIRFRDGYGNSSQYIWDLSGRIVESEDGSIQHIYAQPGSYPVKLTAINGCGQASILRDTVHVSNDYQLSGIDALVFPSNICPGGNILVSADNDLDSLYVDFGDGNAISTGDLADVITHVYSSAGVYEAIITGTNHCGNSHKDTITVTVGSNESPMPPMEMGALVEQSTCPGDSTIMYVITGDSTSVYSIDFGDGESGYVDIPFAVNGFLAMTTGHSYDTLGRYNVKVTTTNQCGLTRIDSFYVDVTPNAPIDIEIFGSGENEPRCLNREIDFYVQGATSFEWNFNDGTPPVYTQGGLEPVTHSFDEPGFYDVTVTGTNGCGMTATDVVDIHIPENLTTVVTSTQNATCGEYNGTAIAIVTKGVPPYSYQWSSGETTAIIDSLSSGTYVVNVTDGFGCSQYTYASVDDAQGPVVIESNIIDASCFGVEDASIDVTVLGNNGPFSFAWSNGETSEDLINVRAGIYELEVSDANDCKASASIQVNEPGAVYLDFASTPAQCGLNDGTATLVITGDNGPYITAWDNGSNGTSLSNLSGGVYGVTVIDGYGCFYDGSVIVNEKEAPFVVINNSEDLSCENQSGEISISISGGVEPYTINWNTGDNNDTITVTNTGTYEVYVEGNNGCGNYAFTTIEEEPYETTPICLVTVDTLTTTNLVVWTKPVTTEIDYFNVYRESSIAGKYQLVGALPYDSLSEWTDNSASPMIRSWRYRITAVDHCGNESNLSGSHKTIHLTKNVSLDGTVNLIWDDYSGFSYSSYNIWKYTDANGWENIASLPSNLNSYSDATAIGESGLDYFIEVEPDFVCTSTKARDHRRTRSNRALGLFTPEEEEDSTGTGSPLSIQEQHVEFKVFPNPSSSNIRVVYEAGQVFNATLVNQNGEVIYSTNSPLGAPIDVSGFAAGIYFIKLETSEGIGFQKLVKL